MIMNAKKQQVFLIVTKESVQCTSFSLSNVLPGPQRATYQHYYPMSAYKKGSRVIVQRKQKIAFYKKAKRNVILFCFGINCKSIILCTFEPANQSSYNASNDITGGQGKVLGARYYQLCLQE